MGYQVTFKPTEEKMAEYKPWKEERPKDSQVDYYRRELISYVMKTDKDRQTFQLAKQIEFLLRCITQTVETDEKTNTYFRWKDDENHEVWFCGWEFAHESIYEKDEAIENGIDRLLVFADIIPTPDYFEEPDKFYKKLEDVKEYINDFIDLMRDLAIHDIINDLDEFKLKDEDE